MDRNVDACMAHLVVLDRGYKGLHAGVVSLNIACRQNFDGVQTHFSAHAKGMATLKSDHDELKEYGNSHLPTSQQH